MDYIIEIDNLSKYYQEKVVLNNISFKVKRGETLGLLGSNGAGKSTLLETIEGLRSVDFGNVKVLGKDISKEYKSIQRNLGIQLQKTSLFGDLSVETNIKLYAGLYDKIDRVPFLMDDFDLSGIARSQINNLSGGQFQRVNLCIAMLNDPEILFLDEPTTGLDPKARKDLWTKISNLKKRGCTVIITTHYMEEAEALCDRIIILHKGNILADEEPKQLVKHLKYPKIIQVEIHGEFNSLCFSDFDYKVEENKIHIKSLDLTKDLITILGIIESQGIKMIDIGFHQASLEDVYLEITNQSTV